MGNIFASKSLPPLGGRADTITISGMSSGSMMTMNLDVIYSETFKGAGMMMGSSYWTPEFATDGKEFYAGERDVQTQASIAKAEENAQKGLIDPLSNLDGVPIYILSGLNDETVPPKSQESQRDFYLNYGANVLFEQEEFGHTFPLDIPTD